MNEKAIVETVIRSHNRFCYPLYFFSVLILKRNHLLLKPIDMGDDCIMIYRTNSPHCIM